MDGKDVSLGGGGLLGPTGSGRRPALSPTVRRIKGVGWCKGESGRMHWGEKPSSVSPKPLQCFHPCVLLEGARERLRSDFWVGRHPLATSSLVGPAHPPLCSHSRRLSGVRGAVLQAQVLSWKRRPGVGRGEKDRRSRSAAGRTRRLGRGLRSARERGGGRTFILTRPLVQRLPF